MSVSEYQQTTIQQFGGAWLRGDVSDIPPGQALLCLNSEFNQGQAQHRFGFAQFWNPNETITSMVNWIFQTTGVRANYLVYYNPSTGNMQVVRDLLSISPQTMYTQAGAVGASITSGGTFLFLATYDANGNGVGQCRVASQYVAALNTDIAFQGPLTAVPTVSNSGTGSVTAGIHNFGYILQTRNGFVGRISPVSGSTFVPVALNAAGGKQVSFSVTTTWPADANIVYPVMSTVNNPNRYFLVPGQSFLVPPGLSFTASFTIDITDADLASTGTDVTNNQLLFTQDTSGNGPFSPNFVAVYGPRTVYHTVIGSVPQAYASEPDNPQYITADQHVLYLPGFKAMSSSFSLNNIYYVLGPHWTYAFQDTGDTPVNWPSAQLIDGNIGTPSVHGTTVNSSRGFAWVCDVTGLYTFQGGRYSTLAVSYMVEPDWKRINWSGAAQTVQVVDNSDKRECMVFVPLDGATTPSHMMMFDYTDDITADKVKYSLWNIVSYNPGSGCIVQNPTTGLLELWIGKSSNGAVGRQMNSADGSPYADFSSSAINWQYETALLPGLNEHIGNIYHHYADQVRATGSGTLNATIYGLDRTKSVAWTPGVTLSNTPGGAYTKRYPRLRSESASIRFTMNVANQHVVLSALDHFYAPGPSFR